MTHGAPAAAYGLHERTGTDPARHGLPCEERVRCT